MIIILGQFDTVESKSYSWSAMDIHIHILYFDVLYNVPFNTLAKQMLF